MCPSPFTFSGQTWYIFLIAYMMLCMYTHLSFVHFYNLNNMLSNSFLQPFVTFSVLGPFIFLSSLSSQMSATSALPIVWERKQRNDAKHVKCQLGFVESLLFYRKRKTEVDKVHSNNNSPNLLCSLYLCEFNFICYGGSQIFDRPHSLEVFISFNLYDLFLCFSLATSPELWYNTSNHIFNLYCY